MEEDRISEIFQKALDQLPHRQKQVFLLRYEEELSYKEISEILQITEGALKATYHIAAEKMEKFIKNQL
jgi:RNA polymerase sigma-70 factor (ECF subfamily)